MKITKQELIEKAAKYVAGIITTVKCGAFNVEYVEKIDTIFSGTEASGCAVTCENNVSVFSVATENIETTVSNSQSKGEYSRCDIDTEVQCSFGMAVHYSWDDIGGFRVFARKVLIACDEKTRKEIEFLATKIKKEKELEKKESRRIFFNSVKSEIIGKYGKKMFAEVLNANVKVSQMISFAKTVASIPHLYEYEKKQVEKFANRLQWRFCPDFAPEGWNCEKTALILQTAIKLQSDLQICKNATYKPFEGLRFLMPELKQNIKIA